jgi:hypothetical protein
MESVRGVTCRGIVLGTGQIIESARGVTCRGNLSAGEVSPLCSSQARTPSPARINKGDPADDVPQLRVYAQINIYENIPNLFGGSFARRMRRF